MGWDEPREVLPVGVVRSVLKDTAKTPKQGAEGAPRASVEIGAEYAPAIQGIKAGDVIVLLTWLHEADRTVLRVHPRDVETAPLAGVFSTRSEHRPNPIGLHEVKVVRVRGLSLEVEPLEAVDGTPVLDVKIAL